MNGGADAPSADLFPAFSITASISMKVAGLLTRGCPRLVCSSWCPVCYLEDQVLPHCSSSSSRSCSSAPWSYRDSSCHQTLGVAGREVDHSLLSQQLREVRGSCFPTSLGDQKPSHLMNLMLALQDDSMQLNAVSTRTRPACPSQVHWHLTTPAPSTGLPSSPGPCWYRNKHREKAVNCQKPCSESEN